MLRDVADRPAFGRMAMMKQNEDREESVWRRLRLTTSRVFVNE